LAILRKRAAHDNVDVTDEALEVLAERVTSNVRALEGALIRLVAYGSLTGRALDHALAADVLARLGVALSTTRAVSIADVQDATCAHFGLSRNELLSRSRAERCVWPRQAAMYLCKELTAHSLPTIARAFDGRDHTTVLHACKRVAAHIAVSPPAYADIEALTATLTAQA
ncbi:MAG: helix-turn-helix domain-containing protein, partial [Solirubrobacteraceae bacterium]